MKPHEETLTLMQFDKERRCLVDGDERMVAVLRSEDAARWEPLLTAAPDMARALVAALSVLRENGIRPSRERKAPCGHAGECRYQRGARVCDEIEASLAKAGVPLP